ncbi:hypothetical protein OHB14_51355 [Streptomyces sp. NBC_01613]|uniref:hypothetical protein n=1 Tax=Streptomyces sp. NBC_01613 TaxID=2975896 RepID=UPI00386B2EB4
MAETVVRPKQLAFLGAASADHGVQVARELTALAPETAVGCAVSLAAETRRRRGASAIAPDARLTSDQRSALVQIASGHVVDANPHLLVSGRTAYDSRPVTSYYTDNLFRGYKATLDRLRKDRWLEEALNRGPDPLHRRLRHQHRQRHPIRASRSPDPRRRRTTTLADSYASSSCRSSTMSSGCPTNGEWPLCHSRT